MLHDMGQGLPFRPGSFDGAISVSAVQWLSYANASSQTPFRRLQVFFSTLYACLKRGARAALQLYPESPEQMELISSAAMSAGFSGGLVVDYPNSAKAKKYYLCLFAGQGEQPQQAPQKQGPSGDGTSIVAAVADDPNAVALVAAGVSAAASSEGAKYAAGAARDGLQAAGDAAR